MRWEYGHEVFAEVDAATGLTLSGRTVAGAYRLRSSLNVRLRGRSVERQVLVLGFWGQLASGAVEVALLQPDERPIISTATTEAQGALSLAADLDFRRLTALDGVRDANGNLPLRLLVWGLAIGPAGLQSFYGQESFVVLRQQWLEALSNCDFGATILQEIVVPREVGNPALAAAVTRLDEAQRKLWQRGSENDAVGAFRVALDEAELGQSLPPQVELHCGEGRSAKDMTLDERLALLAYAIRHATHPPHHAGASPYSPALAKLLLSATTALLSFQVTEYRQQRG